MKPFPTSLWILTKAGKLSQGNAHQPRGGCCRSSRRQMRGDQQGPRAPQEGSLWAPKPRRKRGTLNRNKTSCFPLFLSLHALADKHARFRAEYRLSFMASFKNELRRIGFPLFSFSWPQILFIVSPQNQGLFKKLTLGLHWVLQSSCVQLLVPCSSLSLATSSTSPLLTQQALFSCHGCVLWLDNTLRIPIL